MNGSEEGDVLPAAVLSGAPIELEARTVRYATLGTLLDLIIFLQYLESTVQLKQRHNPEIGMVTTGVWIGIFCPRDIAGKIP